MILYILKHQHEQVDGEYLNGITQDKPIVIIDEKEELDPNYIEINMEDTDDRYVNQHLYKVKTGKIVKMTQAELVAVYPNLNKPPEPTPLETLQQENHLLKAQVNALTEQGEFQDDLIAELATIVYA